MSIKRMEDTIIAIATPPGVGAISVIRMSGPSSLAVIDLIFSGKSEIKNSKSHTIHYGKIIVDSEILDDVLVSVFRSPNSYTGENSVEISLHGSPILAQKIITAILGKSDVRLAEPGEFTKRAFLSGRMDLTQAEAVADLINSRTAISLRGARSQMDGLLSSKVIDLRKKIVDLSSFTELGLDFVEENIEFVERQDLLNRIDEIRNEIGKLINSYSFGKILREGLNVVLAGEPNVGKSSILNYLLKESRAIVSSIPGTTRDMIREEISIDGFLFRLFDTAGIRITNEEIENEGVNRSKDAIKNADIVLFIGDVNVGFSSQLENEIFNLNPPVRIIKILNKIDLKMQTHYLADFKVSAISSEGMFQFIEGLKGIALGESAYTEKDAIVTNVRHVNCLVRANEGLKKAIETIKKNLSGEFIASDLRVTEMALAEIIGEVTPEDILNNIFSKFCVGK